MQLKDVIGHNDIKKRLIKLVKENRVSHAKMFLGPSGYGNLPLAIAFAQYLNCQAPVEGDSCGQCFSCVKYNKLIHPDLHFVFPVTTSKSISKDPVSDDYIKDWRELILECPYFNQNQWYAKIGVENKQGIISKNESQQILHKLNLKTFEADYKIMIIWLPERMNETSANKLLKILEEPPGGTVFMLVSENSENILPTIISRVQITKIPRIDDDSMVMALEEKHGLAGARAIETARLARGDYITVLERLGQSEENQYHFQKFGELMRYAYSRDLVSVQDWVEEMGRQGREKQKSFILYALEMLRENFMLNQKMEKLVFLDSKEKEFSIKFSRFINPENVYKMYNELNQVFMNIEANANNKIVFFDMALRFVKWIKK